MKVTLLNLAGLGLRIRYISSGILPPLGLAYIASALEKEKQVVKIIDLAALKMDEAHLKHLIYHDDADLYGIGSTLFGLKEVLQLSKIIKACKPRSKLVLGGLCTVFSPEIILKRIPEIDIVVKGEGEHTMIELCKAFEYKRDLQDVKGIAFRDNGRIISTPPRPWIDNLDENPLPARHLLLNYRYYPHPPYGLYFPITTIETSRGCISNCNFCLFPSHPYRCRTVKSVVDEIKLVVKNYGIKEIYFVDRLFTVNENRTIELCEEILKQKIKIAWTCKERVDTVSRKLLKKMKEAGCYMIAYGVESGVQEILDNLNKNITISQIEETFKLTKESGIRSIAYLMVGSPGENKDTIQKTIKFINKIEPDFVVYARLMLDPASMLYKNAVKEGILNEEQYANFFFSSDNLEWPSYETLSFPKEEANRWLNLAYKKFYFRPKYWFRRLIDIRNIKDIENMFKGLQLLILDKILQRQKVIG